VVLEAGFDTAASLRNQKWLQSGCFYLTNPPLAQQLWQGFPAIQRTAQRFLLQQTAHFVATSEETLREREVTAAQCAIPLPRMRPDALNLHPVLGPANCVGGFLTPDSVVDFPALLWELRHQLAAEARVVHGTAKQVVRAGDRITGLVYEDMAGEEVWLSAEWYIVCLGAWAPELLAAADISLPVTLRRWRSPVITVAHELTDRIVAWLDGPRLTMVPFRGTTIICNGERVLVETQQDAHSPVPGEVELLHQQLREAFPRLAVDQLTVRGIHT
jgi:glycine/D-amino acid oxidase-like deaminating enzyme